jgi:hypothetical protein
MMQRPKCGEKGIAELLPWYASRSLSETEMVRVEHHLAVCPSCKEELNSIKWISEGLYSKAGENSSMHINSRLLTIYSESRKELKKEVINRIQNHLSSCQQCSKELEILNKVNETLNNSETEPVIGGILQRIREFLIKPVLKPVYAIVLVLVLLYPAWLGLFNNNSIHDKMVGPVNIRKLVVLEQNDTRLPGTQSNEVILENHPDYFAFSFVIPIKNQTDNVFQATISNEQNKVIWQNENLKFIDQIGTVIMVCPQKYFSDGKYTLTIIEKHKQSNMVLNKFLFNFSLLNKD